MGTHKRDLHGHMQPPDGKILGPTKKASWPQGSKKYGY